MKRYLGLFLCLWVMAQCVSLTANGDNREHLYVYNNGEVTADIHADSIDSVAVVNSKYIRFFNKEKKQLAGMFLTKVDSIVCKEAPIVADLLDIEFLPDGSAKNNGSKYISVKQVDGTALSTYYNTQYGRWASHYNHDGSTVASGFYKVDYSSSSSAQTALAQGHSIECVFRPDFLSDGSKEYKMFSAMEGGGTGLLITKTASGKCLTFQPNVTATGSSTWIKCTSGINPEPGRYYHVVGVYNKNEQKAYIYVDGELKNCVDAKGQYFPQPNAAALWFGLGGDASTNNTAQSSWKGDIVIARVYSEALGEEQVKTLYKECEIQQDESDFFAITEITLPVTYKQNEPYTVYGNGFKTGDTLHFEPVSQDGDPYILAGTLGSNSLSVSLPQDFAEGKYRVVVYRGNRSYILGTVRMRALSEGDVSLDGKSVAFVGNSHIYYGGTVVFGGQNALDDGLFAKICQSHKWNTSVYDLTWGGKLISDCVGLINLQASVRESITAVFFNQPVPGTESDFTTACLSMTKLFPNARFYYLLSYYNEDNSTRKTTCLNMVKSLQNSGVDIEVVHWGQLCTDLIKKNVTVPNGKFTYASSSFKISDQAHPNPLAGYIQALAAFCKATGCSAVGQDYSFCKTSSYGRGVSGFSGYISSYYDGDASKTNFDDIFESETEMEGLHTLLDKYVKEN